MGETLSKIDRPLPDSVLSLDDAIALIEAGNAPETIGVDIGHDHLLRADGAKGLQSLLPPISHSCLELLMQLESPFRLNFFLISSVTANL